jgi:hypothetical protein
MADPAMIFRGAVSDRDRARGQRMAAEAANGNHLRKRLWGEGYAETRPEPSMTPAQRKNTLAARKIAQTRVARVIAGSPATPSLPSRAPSEPTTKVTGIATEA